MKKFVMAAMVASLFLVSAPVAQADNDLVGVGVWTCQPKQIKGDAGACHANIPQFPTALMGSASVTSVGGNLNKTETDLEAIPPLEVDEKDALTGENITYSEASCAVGQAGGTLTTGTGSEADTGDFTYLRLGPLAVILVISDEELFIGVVVFEPKEPLDAFALRCVGLANGPLTVNFYGGGLYLETAASDDGGGS